MYSQVPAPLLRLPFPSLRHRRPETDLFRDSISRRRSPPFRPFGDWKSVFTGGGSATDTASYSLIKGARSKADSARDRALSSPPSITECLRAAASTFFLVVLGGESEGIDLDLPIFKVLPRPFFLSG